MLMSMMSMMRTKKLLLLLFLMPNLVMADWRGWIYPDKRNLSEYIVLGRFNSFDECKQTSLLNLKKMPNGDYECGKNCKPMFPSLGEESVQICEETVKRINSSSSYS